MLLLMKNDEVAGFFVVYWSHRQRHHNVNLICKYENLQC